MSIEVGTILALIGLFLTIMSIVIAYLSFQRNVKKDNYVEGEEKGTLHSDVRYLTRITEDTLLQQKETNSSMKLFSERLVKVEESTKSAHHRIDGLEHRKGE